ncbi:hypothetical protein [uncultured Fluviicola sp.]|uniref:hypothetical protein n=1 Tax=uncultured Fluviicola sp. TaxID=463303 RepID=UPI0025DC4C35|nr:hypothetical protein [uncultured Fluviicola sp.]
MNYLKKLLFIPLILFSCTNASEKNDFYYSLNGTMIIDKKQGKTIYLHNMNVPEEVLGFDFSKFYSDLDIEKLKEGDTIKKSHLTYSIIRMKNGQDVTIKSKIKHP